MVLASEGLRRRAGGGLAPALFTVAVFFSAGLVFLVEPLIGKLLLPALGGSPAIWNTSLAFFQAALLAGYGYAHVLQRAGPVRRQIAIHLGVLAVAAVVLPLRISQWLGPPWTGLPALWLLLVLIVSVGPPFAALSATAPLLQAWFARLEAPGRGLKDVYRLYAASNVGSLIALACYPVVVEPLLGLSSEARLWSLAYAGFAALLLVLAILAWRWPQAPATPVEQAPAPSWNQRMAWMLLAAAPSSLLLGVTAHITADVASVPLLWVIPLELYLLTFVVAFGRDRKPLPLWLPHAQLAFLAAVFLVEGVSHIWWPKELAVHLAAFFVTALICHMTLAARRPAPARLTEFYLWVSVGGVLGGAFNAFLAPVLFNDVWEYPAVLVLACLARPDAGGKLDARAKGWLVAGLLWTVPLLIPQIRMPDYVRLALLLTPAVMAAMVRQRTVAVTLLFGAMALAAEIQGFGRYAIHERSFFGVAHVADLKSGPIGPMRILVHGSTLHGAQALTPEYRCTPTTYYALGTVIGEAFATEQAKKPAMRIAAVGLGVGTVAALVRPLDRMRFFEIDPKMERLALDPRRFSFVKDCARGPVDLVLGDARLSLAREPKGAYDLILVDAFSSDSVPTHLLTVEAVRLYLSLLKPDGVIVLHISNRNLALSGPASASAKAAGAVSLLGEHWVTPRTSPYLESAGIALIVAQRPETLDRYRVLKQWKAPTPASRPWTDDYTNVWGAMVAQWRHGY